MSDVAPSFLPAQQESITFNQPTSESSIGSIAALANALRYVILPVGSIVDSMLTEAQFQAENASQSPSIRWILSDGRDVTGSAYQVLTGNTTVPDLTGRFRRGKGANNPDGDLALGTFTAAKFASHTHTPTVTDPGHTHIHNGRAAGNTTITPSLVFINNPQNVATTTALPTSANTTGVTVGIANTGGNDTAPANVTVNSFIRIN